MELDQLLDNSLFSGSHAYSVVFGCSKLSNGVREVTILVSLYLTKHEPVQRKFTGSTFAEAIGHLKEFLKYGTYIQPPEVVDNSDRLQTKTTIGSHSQNLNLNL